MDISTKIDDGIAVINVNGRLDLSSANELKEASREFISQDNCKLILNMENVDFINSSGLGALVSILKDVRSNKGALKISNLASYVREIFEITQLTNIFDICDDESHARQSF